MLCQDHVVSIMSTWKTYPVLFQFRICIGQLVQSQVNISLVIPLCLFFFLSTLLHILKSTTWNSWIFISLHCLLLKIHLLLLAWAYLDFQVILISFSFCLFQQTHDFCFLHKSLNFLFFSYHKHFFPPDLMCRCACTPYTRKLIGNEI